MGLNNLQTGGTGGISPGGLRNLTEISPIPDNPVLLPESDDDTHFSGDTAGISINSNSPVLQQSDNNDLSFKFAPNDGAGTNYDNVYSTSGLPNYPQVGTKTIFGLYAQSGEDQRVYWSTAGGILSSDCYGLIADFGGGNIGYIRRDGGSNPVTNTDSFSWTTGQFYVIEVTHESGGAITIDAYSDYSGSSDVTFTATDGTHLTSGSFDQTGIGFRNFSSSDIVVDWWHNA